MKARDAFSWLREEMAEGLSMEELVEELNILETLVNTERVKLGLLILDKQEDLSLHVRIDETHIEYTIETETIGHATISARSRSTSRIGDFFEAIEVLSWGIR